MSTPETLPSRTAPGAGPFLIVTGDDFGQSSAVNRAIQGAHRDGILTSASLLVNEPGTEEAVEMARRTPTLAVGLHLALSSSTATLPIREIPTLVDSGSRFLESPTRAGWRYFFRKGAALELEKEIRAQIEKFLGTGLPLDHLDGHQHLHLHPTIFPIVARACREYGIPGVRIVRDPFFTNVRIDRSRVWSKAALSMTFALLGGRARRLLQESPVQTADRVYGLLQDGCIDTRRLQALLASSQAGVTELYVHPSMGDDRGRREYAALVDADSRRMLESAGVTRVTYGDLARCPALLSPSGRSTSFFPG